jgi:hypothetical protein
MSSDSVLVIESMIINRALSSVEQSSTTSPTLGSQRASPCMASIWYKLTHLQPFGSDPLPNGSPPRRVHEGVRPVPPRPTRPRGPKERLRLSLLSRYAHSCTAWRPPWRQPLPGPLAGIREAPPRP